MECALGPQQQQSARAQSYYYFVSKEDNYTILLIGVLHKNCPLQAMNFIKDLLPFSEAKLRPNLKMAAQRIQLVNSKKENGIKHQKREVSYLL